MVSFPTEAFPVVFFFGCMSHVAPHLDKWERSLASILEEESFGQIIEATEGYQSLAALIGHVAHDKADPKKPAPALTPDERAVLTKLQKCFIARRQVLIGPNSPHSLSLTDIKAIHRDFRQLFTGIPFPVDTLQFATIKLPHQEEAEAEAESPFQDENRGCLLPCPTRLRPGEEIVRLTISHIGLKDAASYLDPFFNVSIRGADGSEVEEPQDTPHPSTARKDRSVEFAATVFLQTPLHLLPDDAAVFFEFRHWKPKKNKFSTRCWSMLTIEEIKKHKEASLTLEIYAKPADYKRKKFVRHSVKDLWLHVSLGFVKG